MRSARDLVLLAASLSLFACGGAASSGEGASSATGDSHPLVGSPAPDFSQSAVANGDGTLSIRSLHGKVTIVDFWATWCEPCKKSFPKLQDLNVKYKASGLVIVGISEDDEKGGIPAFAKELGAKFPLAWDADKGIAGKWKPKSMPSTFIVDRNGVVRFAHFGYHDGEETEIEREVKSLM